MNRDCSQCDCAVRVIGGRSDDRVCANHPDHPGQLVLLGCPNDAGPRCRGFRPRRDAGPPPPSAKPDDPIRYIDLTGGFFAIVDAADYEWLSKFTWRVTGGYSSYACCKIANKTVYMHRLIMNPPAGKVVDHFNGSRWDNRRSNLRICTQAENLRNRRKSGGTSRFKGVFWHIRRHKWLAVIGHMGKSKQLGFFADEVEAARAYDRAAKELFGQYAYLNFPEPTNVVWMSGSITAHSHMRGEIHVARANPKFEARNPKQIRMTQITNPKHPHPFALASRSLEHSDFRDCFGFRHSCFGFPFSRGPPWG